MVQKGRNYTTRRPRRHILGTAAGPVDEKRAVEDVLVHRWRPCSAGVGRVFVARIKESAVILDPGRSWASDTSFIIHHPVDTRILVISLFSSLHSSSFLFIPPQSSSCFSSSSSVQRLNPFSDANVSANVDRQSRWYVLLMSGTLADKGSRLIQEHLIESAGARHRKVPLIHRRHGPIQVRVSPDRVTGHLLQRFRACRRHRHLALCQTLRTIWIHTVCWTMLMTTRTTLWMVQRTKTMVKTYSTTP